MSQLLAILLVVLADSPEVDVAQIRQKSAESLRLLQAGEVEYELSFGHLKKGSTEIQWSPPHCRDHVIYDLRKGRYVYQNRWTPHEATLLRSGETFVRRSPDGGSFEKVIIRPDRVYEYFPDPLSDKSYLGINEDIPKNNPIQLRFPYNPWDFGLIPEVIESGNQYTFEALTRVAPGESPSLEQDQINGSLCWRIQYRPESDRTATVWYDPEKDYRVVRVAMEGSHEAWAWRNTVDSKLLQYPEGGVWYPAEVLMRSERVGSDDPDTLILERIQVTKASFNRDIPAEQFTIAGLKPAAGVKIIRRFDSDDPEEEWNGEQVVERPKAEAVPVIEKQKWSNRSLFIIAGNVFLIVGILAWSFWRSRGTLK